MRVCVSRAHDQSQTRARAHMRAAGVLTRERLLTMYTTHKKMRLVLAREFAHCTFQPMWAQTHLYVSLKSRNGGAQSQRSKYKYVLISCVLRERKRLHALCHFIACHTLTYADGRTDTGTSEAFFYRRTSVCARVPSYLRTCARFYEHAGELAYTYASSPILYASYLAEVDVPHYPTTHKNNAQTLVQHKFITSARKWICVS